MLITDAVCVKFLSKDEIIAGIGNQLHYFYLENGQTKTKICSHRTRDKIKDLKFIRTTLDKPEYQILVVAGRLLLLTRIKKNEFCQTFTFKINDWISSIKFSTSHNEIFLVTAHNRACCISVDYESENGTVNKRTRCEDYSTAYTSLIDGDAWENVVFFAGTAFGELIVWQPSHNTEVGIIVLRVENAHNGVIFNIDLSLKDGLLTTTSDDRSIQLWNILRKEDKHFRIERIKRCFAHTARVFYSKIIHEGNKIYILSVGEDSKVCLWDETGKLLHKKQIGSGGATLWALDYCSKLKTAIVSSSNGQLIPVHLRNLFTNETTKQDKMIIEFPCCTSKEHVSKVKYLQKAGILIGLSTHNRLVFMRDGENSCTNIQLPIEHKYCILQTHKYFVYLATTDSKVYIYEYSPLEKSLKFKNEVQLQWKLLEYQKASTMIRAMLPLGSDSVIVCNNLGEFHIVDDAFFQGDAVFLLPKCSEPWITSALKIENVLLIGDRCGSLHLFQMGQTNPVHTLKKLHGNLGITLIQSLDLNILRTAGHDGCFKTVVVEKDCLKCIHTEKLPVNWIERHIGNLTFGFNDSHFICYNPDQGVIYEQDCGGGHRQWDLFWSDSSVTFSVVFIQHKKVVKIKVDLNHYLKTSICLPDVRWHHHNCNILKIINYSNTKILMSGGEDTMLKFFRILQDSIRLEPIVTSYQHISNVKAFITVTLDNLDVLLVSVGGRAQICISRITGSKLRVEEEMSYMLYETDATRKREGKAQDILYDPETRITSIVHVPKNDQTNQNSYLICACSDGFIRIFKIFLNQKPVNISLEQEIYYGKCLLHIHSFKMENHIFVVSIGTDGIINFWNFQDMSKPIWKIRHHESGVNAFDFYQTDTEIKLMTGGDDQSVVCSEIFCKYENNELRFLLKNLVTINDLHTAQVTGVRMIDNGRTLLSTGLDQMIYRYSLTADGGYEIETAYWTSVADVKGLVHDDNLTVVFGNGLEIIN